MILTLLPLADISLALFSYFVTVDQDSLGDSCSAEMQEQQTLSGHDSSGRLWESLVFLAPAYVSWLLIRFPQAEFAGNKPEQFNRMNSANAAAQRAQAMHGLGSVAGTHSVNTSKQFQISLIHANSAQSVLTRRIVLKSIAYTLMGLAALIMGPTVAWGGSLTLASGTWLSASALGQTGNAESDRAQVKQLLTQARTAMEQKDLVQADKLIAQAEGLNVQYSLFEIVDTPKKARRDLEKAKAAATPAGTTDPFANRTATATPAAAIAAAPAGARYPDTGARYPETSTPAAPGIVANAAPMGDRAVSDGSLLAARRFLAVGDTQRAAEMVAKAKSQNIQYGLQEDSPVKVEAILNKYQDVMSRRNGRENTDGWRRSYSEVLMQQAEVLMLWSELDEAERLANSAAALNISYAPFETNPRTLLDRIAQQRNASATPGRLAVSQAEATPVGTASPGNKDQAVALVAQGRAAIQRGDLAAATKIAEQALALGVPDTEFNVSEDRPWLLSLDIEKARTRNAGVTTAAASSANGRYSQSAVYDPNADQTYNQQVQASAPEAATSDAPAAPQPAGLAVEDPAQPKEGATGVALFQQGESALKANDKASALRYFRAANAHLEELDNPSRERLANYLQVLAAAPNGGESLIENAAARQEVLTRKISAEIADRQSEARRLRETDPRKSLEILNQALETLSASQLDAASKSQLKRRVEISIDETESFIAQNRPQIELDAKNKAVIDDINQTREVRHETQVKIEEGVKEYNKLVDEHRYSEAEVIAKRLREMAPEEPVVRQLWINARQLIRMVNNDQLMDDKEQAVWNELNNIEISGIPGDSNTPMIFPDAQEWGNLSKRRREAMVKNRNGRRTDRELEIERKLITPISVNFQETPLGEVMAHLTRLAGINVHLDPRGLNEEGVTSNTPVTISLEQEVSLKSALNLILEPLQLSYVIKDEVLKITSSQLKDGEVYTVTYNVADLVIPIPNFVPGNQLGLSGQLAEAYGNMGYGGGPMNSTGMTVIANKDGKDASGVLHPKLMAQLGQGGGGAMGGMGGMGGGGMGSSPIMGPGAGPGGLGGAVQPDFDSLIELITGTIQPNTWDGVGGPGSVKEFETNLSLVISQTQDVHEEIVDLLEQLRRLQDLQVTIEVRFIRLADDFFERIGVDFDFNIESSPINPATGLPYTQQELTDRVENNAFQKPSLVAGITGTGSNTPPSFTSNLDVPFAQNSFSVTPTFGGFDANTAAKFGFAILSDIEAFFLIEAAQGDTRSNVLEAPKVTLFNGQQAFVSDTTQRPFVISVIPVVGDFAAAQQPVIVVLSEGTHLNVQAVVSNDRRYVRLTVIPYFSQIGNVEEFTFDGARTTTEESEDTGLDPDGNPTDTAQKKTTAASGTTVQLPEFSFVTVTTTVSVPDGGTVLLGGIKRLSEGRSEQGVPLLSKLPYINRLFRNVGIGRTSASLMMMVTPRIIIQEEEEERLGISQP